MFLPETVDGLANRLNRLYPKFKLEKKQEQRNELVAILDELLRQDELTREGYTKLNNDMAKCLDAPTTLRSAVNRILKPATDELHGIICDFKRRGIAENERECQTGPKMFSCHSWALKDTDSDD